MITPAILVALSKRNLQEAVDKVWSLIATQDMAMKNQGIFALGSFDFSQNPSLALETLQKVVDIIEKPVDDATRACGIHACASLAKHSPTKVDWISRVLKDKSATTDLCIHAFAQLLAFECPSAVDERRNDIIRDSLLFVKETSTGTINFIDMYLANLIDKNNLPTAMDLAGNFISRDENNIPIELLGDFCHSILTKGKLSHLVTQWFMSGKPGKCKAIEHILGNIHGKHPAIEVVLSSEDKVTDADMLFLARKSIGYLFTRPISAASMVISCADRCVDEDSKNNIIEYLFDPLLLNYSGELVEFLKKTVGERSDSVGKMIERQVQKHDDWTESIKAIGQLTELQPNARQRLMYMRYMQDNMKQSFAKASEDAIFLQLAAKVTILYGNKVAGKMRISQDLSQRMETEMGSKEFKVEIPRESSLDPWGIDFRLRVMRSEKMEQ